MSIDPKTSKLAGDILDWLRVRNGARLGRHIDRMTVVDFERMHAELELILHHEGRPPNWIKS